jgi:lipopolysaccharide export LptBFGC system permease protein LptF
VNSPQFQRRRQKAVVLVGFLLFALILFLIQLWLFVMVLENFLAGKTDMVIQASIFSFILLGINVWMLVGVNRLLKMK